MTFLKITLLSLFGTIILLIDNLLENTLLCKTLFFISLACTYLGIFMILKEGKNE